MHGAGYGQFRLSDGKLDKWSNRPQVYAHRYAYEFCVGPIPEGLTIDHLCRVRACVRPDHLEPVTMRINTLRGVSIVAQHARKTQCPQEHPYDSENTYIDPLNKRHCRICMRWRERERKLRLRRLQQRERVHAQP